VYKRMKEQTSATKTNPQSIKALTVALEGRTSNSVVIKQQKSAAKATSPGECVHILLGLLVFHCALSEIVDGKLLICRSTAVS
jgi:hypothetical protein